MIERTKALVLRIMPFSHTSHVVAWLTVERGCLHTIVKGACRPKSAFLGQYDLFYTCELLYYARERAEGLHVARACFPIAVRKKLREDWRAAGCASYACDLLWRTHVTGDSSEPVYRLTTGLLDELCAERATLNLLLWYELRLATLLGFGPRLESCADCGRSGIEGASKVPVGCWRFRPERGGVLCPRCAAEDGYALAPDIMTILRRWQVADSPRTARRTRCTTQQHLALRRFLGMFYAEHLDPPPAGRSVAMELLTHPPSALATRGPA